MKRILSLILLSVFALQAEAAGALRVRIYTGTSISSFSFTVTNGNYLLSCNGSSFSLAPGSVCSFLSDGDSIRVKKNDSLVGKFAVVYVNELNRLSGVLKIKIVNPDKTPRLYDGGLEIGVENKQLRLLNIVDIERYTAGVIQAEVGKMNPVEFNKVKAEIIRTYSLSNLRKHETENFHLCDQVHCQVYRGKCSVDGIVKAVDETKGLVLVDTSINLVNASFFSNCGGQTCNSEDVWIKALPYLRSVKDTFCCRMPDACWEKKISKKEWLEYFYSKFKITSTDTQTVKQLLSFRQDERKTLFLSSPVIPLKMLRDDWKLKSTYFSVQAQGDQVILKGKGFGHGVGLCQEGAMRMAKAGYSCKQIIDFYYKDVTLIDLAKLEFFKEE